MAGMSGSNPPAHKLPRRRVYITSDRAVTSDNGLCGRLPLKLLLFWIIVKLEFKIILNIDCRTAARDRYVLSNHQKDPYSYKKQNDNAQGGNHNKTQKTKSHKRDINITVGTASIDPDCILTEGS